MKFLQILLGLNGSLATYACPWCKVEKDARGIISFGCNHYNEIPQCRRIEEMKTAAASSSTPKESFGSKHQPLLNIEPDHYIPDELHLLMRITDILLRNVIDDASGKDQHSRLFREKSDNLAILTSAIESCGVSFKTWTTKTGEMEYTSLTGTDKKKVLKHLPDKMFFCLHEETRDDVINLWKEFESLYLMMTQKSEITAESDAELVFEKARKFVEDFLELGQKNRVGYLPKNVTPYMHVLVYHVPFFFKRYGSLAKFSGQAVEKTNDVIKRIHQCKSSKHDATVEALLVRKRQELSFHCSKSTRVKRVYNKQDDHFWNVRKAQLAKNKKNKIHNEMKTADKENKCATDNLSELTTEEIKLSLKQYGVKTKLRKHDKLLALLKSVSEQ